VGEEDRKEGDGGGEVEPEGECGREGEGTTRRRRRRRRWGRGRRRAFIRRRSGTGGGGIGLRHCCWLGLLAGVGEWSEQWDVGKLLPCLEKAGLSGSLCTLDSSISAC
jgi:hypothetical protein